MPSSRLEVFEDAGHFPHLDEPQRFLDVLLDFIESTDPADVDPEEWREMLKTGRRAARRPLGAPKGARADLTRSMGRGLVERVLLVLVDVVLGDNGGRHDELARDLRRHELGEALHPGRSAGPC